MPMLPRTPAFRGRSQDLYKVVQQGEKVRADAKRKTPLAGGPAAVVDAIVAVIKDLGGTDGIKGVGVGAPGAVDHEAGVVRPEARHAVRLDQDLPEDGQFDPVGQQREPPLEEPQPLPGLS